MYYIQVDNIELKLGMIFVSKQFVIKAINHKKRLYKMKNTTDKIKVQCMNNDCNSVMCVREQVGMNTGQMRVCNKEENYNCERHYNLKWKINGKFVAEDFLQLFKDNPKVKWKKVQDYMREKYHVNITKIQARKAKMKAKKLIHGSYKEQYQILWEYAL